MASVIKRSEWANDGDRLSGMWPGGAYGSDVSVIVHASTTPGSGPKLHRHPYPETFVVLHGRALFTVGDDEIEASDGMILVVPANTPHAFSTLGPFESVNIHEHTEFITEWLE